MAIYRNAITLRGFLGKDAESHTTQNQSPVTTFSLATKASYKDKQGEWQSRTEWHRCVAYGKLAEDTRSFAKGAYIEVEGELVSREYTQQVGEGKQKLDVKRRVWEIRVNSITRLERTPREVEENLEAEPVEDGVPA